MSVVPLLGFTHKYQDLVTSVYPLGNGYRPYLPWLMRFASPDSFSPFGSGGANGYVYCDADPITRTDPTGHSWEEEFTLDLGEAAGNRGVQFNFSIAAENAVDWSSVHSQSASSPAEWARKNSAATIFQRNWKGFTTARKHAADDSLNMLNVMGSKLTNANDYSQVIGQGRVIVDMNGTPGDPLRGHSSFYKGNKQYELTVDRPKDASVPQSKKSISLRKMWFLNDKFPTHADYHYGDQALIQETDASTEGAVSNLEKRVSNGRVFVLNPEYSENFQNAYDKEVENFRQLPYSFGEYYNCNVFVRNVLHRLLFSGG